MQGHPGGDAHTRYLIELSFLPPGSRWLDMGAGDGQALAISERGRLFGSGHRSFSPEPEGGNWKFFPYPL